VIALQRELERENGDGRLAPLVHIGDGDFDSEERDGAPSRKRGSSGFDRFG